MVILLSFRSRAPPFARILDPSPLTRVYVHPSLIITQCGTDTERDRFTFPLTSVFLRTTRTFVIPHFHHPKKVPMELFFQSAKSIYGFFVRGDLGPCPPPPPPTGQGFWKDNPAILKLHGAKIGIYDFFRLGPWSKSSIHLFSALSIALLFQVSLSRNGTRKRSCETQQAFRFPLRRALA